MELKFEIKNHPYDSEVLKLLGDWKVLMGDKKDQKELPKPENVELKECVKKFISYYQQGIFNYQEEIHPYLWWISEHIWAFRAHNLNNSFDVVFVDTNNWKATYFYNCKLGHNDSIDYNNESPQELNLTLKYDYFKEL